MIRLLSPEKLLEFFMKRSPREKAVLGAALVVIAAAFVDRVIVASVSGRIRELDSMIAAREAEIRTDLRIVAQKQRIEVQSVGYKPYMGSMSTENEEFTALLKEIDALAQAGGVYVVDMKPSATKEMGEGKKYMVNINIEAEIPSLVQFMYAVENSKKLMTVEKYQISPKSKDSRTAKCSLLVSKLVIP